MVMVDNVEEGSAAQLLGVKTGDVLIGINGKTLHRVSSSPLHSHLHHSRRIHFFLPAIPHANPSPVWLNATSGSGTTRSVCVMCVCVKGFHKKHAVTHIKRNGRPVSLSFYRHPSHTPSPISQIPPHRRRSSRASSFTAPTTTTTDPAPTATNDTNAGDGDGDVIKFYVKGGENDVS